MSSGVLVVAFTSLTIGSLIIDIDSQEPPQAPQVQTKNKTDSALERDKQGQSEKGNSQNTTIPKAQVSPFIGDDKSSGDSRKSDEEGHEFLPPLFGYKVKVTDAFLSLFTLGLFIATWFLYRATRDLVRGAE